MLVGISVGNPDDISNGNPGSYLERNLDGIPIKTARGGSTKKELLKKSQVKLL